MMRNWCAKSIILLNISRQHHWKRVGVELYMYIGDVDILNFSFTSGIPSFSLIMSCVLRPGAQVYQTYSTPDTNYKYQFVTSASEQLATN